MSRKLEELEKRVSELERTLTEERKLRVMREAKLGNVITQGPVFKNWVQENFTVPRGATNPIPRTALEQVKHEEKQRALRDLDTVSGQKWCECEECRTRRSMAISQLRRFINDA